MKLLQSCKRAFAWWVSFTNETLDAIKKAKEDNMKR
jgi:hypothetical protein